MSSNKSSAVIVGMGGWDLPPFSGVFYPATKKPGFRKLEFYSRFFDLVEVNSTFYTTAISPAQAQQWINDVAGNKRFVFTVKLFKGFTHTRDASPRDVDSVRMVLETLASAGKLDGLIMQFHHSFTNTDRNRSHLLKLGSLFPGHTLFAELRHNSWNQPAVATLMHENNINPVNVDLPQINNHMPLTGHATTEVAYFRLMGRNIETWNQPFSVDQRARQTASDRYLYFYTENELNRIAGLIRSLKPNPRRTFVVFHNDPNAQSLVNGFQLRKILNPKEELVIPSKLVERFPVLQGLGETDEPQYRLL